MAFALTMVTARTGTPRGRSASRTPGI